MGSVVALLAVVKAAFLVLLLAGVAVAFPADLAGGAARSVAGVVVAVVGLGRAAGYVAQLFGEVPVHRGEVRHGRHAAVGVVGEVRGGVPDRGTCQAVAVRGVSVSPSPLRPIKLMNHRQDIPDTVVFPFAGIVPHGGAVLRAYLCGIPVFAEKF